MGSRPGLDGCGKSRPPPGFDPQTVQAVSSRYTDRAIPALRYTSYFKNKEELDSTLSRKKRGDSLRSIPF